MTKHIFTTGNVTTTVLDLTEGLGERTPEDILRLTKDGTIKEYSELLPDGRTITYSLEVEEEVLEEEEEIEINSTRTVGTRKAETGEILTSILEGEEIKVSKSLSRTVSREEGVTSREVIQSQEMEGGASFSLEWSGPGERLEERTGGMIEERLGERTGGMIEEKPEEKPEESEQLESQDRNRSPNTFLSDQGVLVTEL